MRQIDFSNDDDVVNIHPEMKNLLSHRVFPIPPRMLTDLWDYGALDRHSETSYISAMIKKLNLPSYLRRCFCNCIIKAQNYIKDDVEKQQSSVSLRDIKRVIKIFHFYATVIIYRKHKKNYLKDKSVRRKEGSQDDAEFYKNRYNDFDEFMDRLGMNYAGISEEVFVRATVITLIVNYVFRISTQGNFYLLRASLFLLKQIW